MLSEQLYVVLVVYGYGQNLIWGVSKGIGPLRMRDRKWRDLPCPEVTEVCSAHAWISPAFFLTRVVVQNVGTRDLRSRDSEGVPLRASMRHRVPQFFRMFWPEMTLPIGLKKDRKEKKKKDNQNENKSNKKKI